ncbi:MAG: LicD family protein [Bacteroidales bacterium]|nr:LicD family protein [Bacteroidales bacterium]
MIGQYTEKELAQLHTVLYEILGEVDRVCSLLDIPYCLIGGSGIGAFFEKAILPWDDDIDLGMTRENYQRFQREAPALLRPEYELQNVYTDPHCPYYFAKLMKRNTLFEEALFSKVPMMKGIFVDIFPLDKVPDARRPQLLQRKVGQFINCCLMGKEIWMWKHFGKCQVEHPTNRGALPCLLTRIVCALFSKMQIYRVLEWWCSRYNRRNDCTYYNLVLFPRDHISVDSMEHPQRLPFGPLVVPTPRDLEIYLNNHYPGLTRYVPKEKQANHHPMRLCFNTADEREQA